MITLNETGIPAIAPLYAAGCRELYDIFGALKQRNIFHKCQLNKLII